MEIQQVPAANMAAMAFALILSVGVPAALCAFAMIRWKARFSSFIAGFVTFSAAVFFLEQIFHSLVLGFLIPSLPQHFVLYAAYAGITAAVFEECARYVTMAFFMRKPLLPANALMYGIGHGGAEAILLVGMTNITNLTTSFMINNGQLAANLATVDAAAKETMIQSLSSLWTLPASQFVFGGLERIPAIALQIALSLLVFESGRTGKKQFFLLALAIHFLVDFITVLTASVLPLAATEGLVLLMAAAACAVTVKLCKESLQHL